MVRQDIANEILSDLEKSLKPSKQACKIIRRKMRNFSLRKTWPFLCSILQVIGLRFSIFLRTYEYN